MAKNLLSTISHQLFKTNLICQKHFSQIYHSRCNKHSYSCHKLLKNQLSVDFLYKYLFLSCRKFQLYFIFLTLYTFRAQWNEMSNLKWQICEHVLLEYNYWIPKLMWQMKRLNYVYRESTHTAGLTLTTHLNVYPVLRDIELNELRTCLKSLEQFKLKKALYKILLLLLLIIWGLFYDKHTQNQ